MFITLHIAITYWVNVATKSLPVVILQKCFVNLDLGTSQKASFIY